MRSFRKLRKPRAAALMLWILEFNPSVTALVMWCFKYVNKLSRWRLSIWPTSTNALSRKYGISNSLVSFAAAFYPPFQPFGSALIRKIGAAQQKYSKSASGESVAMAIKKKLQSTIPRAACCPHSSAAPRAAGWGKIDSSAAPPRRVHRKKPR